MTTPPEIPEAIVEKAARAIFFDQHIIMHNHEKNWRKANQVIWLSAARAALSAVAPMLTEPLKAEIKRLHARLEDDHVFRFDKGTEEFIREEVEPGSIPDGIEARDCTIKLQDEEIARLKAQAPMLIAQGMRDASRMFDTGSGPHAILARAAEIDGGKG